MRGMSTRSPRAAATPPAPPSPPSAPSPTLNEPRTLLGGLSPVSFMRRHWQRKPLLVRGAVPQVQPPLSRAALFDLAQREDVESRLVQLGPQGWNLRHGPLPRRSLPPLTRPQWTLLVQGLDLHVAEAHALLRRFDFIAQARLDDLMVSYASDGGGVGPHLDSYDVFLLQVQGQRRWRIAPPGDTTWVPDVPLRILAHFEPTEEWVLEPGDMLYLPPGWAHDGVAVGGDCMTASIGFRSPTAQELAAALVQRMAEELEEDKAESGPWSRRHADPRLGASENTGAIPNTLQTFATHAVQRLLSDSEALDRALGSWVTEPKPVVWFEAGGDAHAWRGAGLVLDRRSRMAYDQRHLFLNGEAYRIGGRDAQLLRRLADTRRLSPKHCAALSSAAQAAVEQWCVQGWMGAEDPHQFGAIQGRP